MASPERQIGLLLLISLVGCGTLHVRNRRSEEVTDLLTIGENDEEFTVTSPEPLVTNNSFVCLMSHEEMVEQCGAQVAQEELQRLCDSRSLISEISFNGLVDQWKLRSNEIVTTSPSPPPSSTDEEGETPTPAPTLQPQELAWSHRSDLTMVALSRDLLARDVMTDCVFLVGKDKQEMRALSAFLIRASGKLEAVLREAGPNTKILLPDITPEVFKEVLDHVYTGELCVTEFAMACELARVAAAFELPRLARLSQDFLWQSLEPSNVWEALRCADAANDTRLRDIALKMTEMNTEDALKDPAFSTISQATLEAFLSKEHLNVASELRLVDAALLWAMAETVRRGLPPDPESMRLALGPAITQLRFLALTPGEFANMQSTSRILNYSESLSVIFNLNSPGVTPLPPNLSTSKEPRRAPSVTTTSGEYFHVRFFKPTCSLNITLQAQDKKVDEKLVSRRFRVRNNPTIIGIQVPSQIGLTEDSYDEDFSVRVMDTYGQSYETRYENRVSYNSLITVMLSSGVSIRGADHYNARYCTITVEHRTSGRYPKMWKRTGSRVWGQHVSSSGKSGYIWEFSDQNSFIYSVISTDSDSNYFSS